ncbi:D-alanine--D-alanine ligase [Stappia sp. BW2]|uniref:D-alanine--D-alanine ligase family protein n=1 Tax=Stappia sp. BW2 TaxID=2592622 RepID=UPI0011DE9819|nr:D-alanine--D-alanine ligase family protein [Stappia sp. BW2]TYC65712.1 D-alanine--D-alanine ligase [Stappia sp. BW2]
MTSQSQKLHVAVLFGGRSAEHEVSVLSATNVMHALDPSKYDAVPVYVTREGQWLLSSYENGNLTRPSSGSEICLVPGGKGRAIALDESGAPHDLAKLDALFPVLHGLHGEDGAVQGLAEVARVPLVGCGIAGSANALDKDLAKRLLTEAGLPTARSITIRPDDAPAFELLKTDLGQPVFIKPARQGSSVGVSKVTTATEYDAALEEGFKHDSKLLAEEFVLGREIEFAVLEECDGTLFVSRPGEIAPAESHGFYTYDAKYVDEDGAALKVPAELPSEVESRLKELAAKAFRALGCDGMARVDFFVTQSMDVLINELNTIPGFTNISMYSKAMAASGVSYPEIIDRLIAHGIARSGRDI